MEWDKLWTIYKKIIDPVCPRYSAVPDKPFVHIISTFKKYEVRDEAKVTKEYFPAAVFPIKPHI